MSSKACGPEGNAREEELRKGALGRVKSLSVYHYSSRLGPMAHIPPAPLPPPPSSSPELNSSPSTSLLTSLDAAAADRVDIVPADPIVDNECAVCLLPITASTLARLAACPHLAEERIGSRRPTHFNCFHVLSHEDHESTARSDETFILLLSRQLGSASQPSRFFFVHGQARITRRRPRSRRGPLRSRAGSP